ncbi:MAG: HAMP domain-containing protein [Colwellia sp.]|nr:HAMP domain-containing protein [Colwellia sp.]
MNIKQRLIISSLTFFISMLSMLLLMKFSSTALHQETQVIKDIGSIKFDIAQLRRHEKDFDTRKELKYLDKYKETFLHAQEAINHLEADLSELNLHLDEPKRLAAILKEYQTTFNRIVEIQVKIGLDENNGLYGALRKEIHKAESLFEFDKQNLLMDNLLLQLRRSEKDFLLRLDEKYIDAFNRNLQLLQQSVISSELSESSKNTTGEVLNKYGESFIELTGLQKKIGLDYKKGQRLVMRDTVHQVDDILASLLSKVDEKINAYSSFLDLLTNSLFLLALVSGVGLSIYISKGINSSISQMQSTMHSIADGKDLSINLDISGKDELATMAEEINSMLKSFSSLIAEVNSSVVNVEQSTVSLSNNVNKTNQGVAAQMQETDMVATAVTEMVATIEEIARTTTETAAKAELANQNSVKGQARVSQTIVSIETLTNKLAESEAVVKELADDSKTIGSVLDVIRGIAEQTNLLALNAAIEAARAGEQGRGFAVVADEVRNLASRTQDSTKEIETIISSLQGRTHDIVGLMKECREQGGESAKQASLAGDMLTEIGSDIVTISDMTTSIAAAIQQQSTVAAEVNTHVVAIRDVTEVTALASDENAQMSDDLAQQAVALKAEVATFKV